MGGCYRLLGKFVITGLIFGSAVYAGPVIAAAGPVLTVTENVSQLNLSPYLGIKHDRDNSLEFKDIVNSTDWQPNSEKALALGRLGYPVWIRLQIQKTDAASGDLILELSDPLIDRIDIYRPATQGYSRLTAGDGYPFATRELPGRTFAFHLNPVAGETATVYLRLEATSVLYSHVTLWGAGALQTHLHFENMMLGGLYGILAVMILYNLMLLISLRERRYFYYVMYVIGIFIMMLILNGSGLKYLWPESVWFQNKGSLYILPPTFFFAIMFAFEFLDVRSYVPKVYKYLRLFFGLLVVLAALGPLFALADEVLLAKRINNILALGAILFLPLAGYLSLLGNREAKFYLAAWSFLLIGTILRVLPSSGIFPPLLVSAWAFQIGAVIEVVVISLGLADQINYYRDRLQVVNEDLEQRVRERTAELAHSASHDSLTGLPNRLLFFDRLGQAISKSGRFQDFRYAVLFIDLDHFKHINDRLGHLAGDQLLVAIARRLKSCIRTVDTVARFGGDEFVFLLEGMTGDTDETIIASRILQTMRLPVKVEDDALITITTSVGIAVGNGEETPEQILKRADTALYKAKRNGKNCFSYFDDSNRPGPGN